MHWVCNMFSYSCIFWLIILFGVLQASSGFMLIFNWRWSFVFLYKRVGIGFLPTNCEDVIHVSYDAKTNIFQISINMTIRSNAVNNWIRLIQRFKSLCTVYHVLTNMFWPSLTNEKTNLFCTGFPYWTTSYTSSVNRKSVNY